MNLRYQVIGKIKQNELDCHDTAPLTYKAKLLLPKNFFGDKKLTSSATFLGAQFQKLSNFI